MMMVGEIEFVENWIEPLNEDELEWPYLNFLMLLLFVVLMPILFINLLVSLTLLCSDEHVRFLKAFRIAKLT